MKGGLLQAIAKEPEARVVHALCHAVAELCATILAAPGWPEILPAVVQLGKSDKAPHRRAACFLFGKIAEYCGDVCCLSALAVPLLLLVSSIGRGIEMLTRVCVHVVLPGAGDACFGGQGVPGACLDD